MLTKDKYICYADRANELKRADFYFLCTSHSEVHSHDLKTNDNKSCTGICGELLRLTF